MQQHHTLAKHLHLFLTLGSATEETKLIIIVSEKYFGTDLSKEKVDALMLSGEQSMQL